MNRSTKSLTIAAALILSSAAGTLARVDIGALPAGTANVVGAFPGVQVVRDQGLIRTIAGVRMTQGATARAAMDKFFAQYPDAFGVPNLDLRETWTATMADGKRTVFAFQQYIGGLPVEHGIARVLTVPDARGIHAVTYAAGTLAPVGEAGLGPALITGDMALALVQGRKDYSKLPTWSKPELVVWQGEGQWVTPIKAWKFVGEVPEPEKRQKWTFFVDARTGLLSYVRNELLSIDVTGVVQGKATPGLLPDSATNPPVFVPMSEIRIGVVSGLPGYTDRNGNFSLFTAGSAPVQVTSAVGPGAGSGQWVWVDDRSAAAELSITQSVTPGTPATISFNSAPSEFTTAQVNAFVNTNKVHNFYRDRSGTWSLIDSSMRANVNLAQTCNAFYDGASINFFKAGGGCANTAYADVIAHEFGHHVVNQLGLGQGGFGEGFSDCGAMLLFDTTILGQNFSGTCPVRTPLVATPPPACAQLTNPGNIQFPCSATCQGEIHCCGQILGGVWLRIRQNFGTYYGSNPGLAKTQQMFVDWMLIATGGTGPSFTNSAHEATAIEVLTINDDDGDLTNGTPDYARIAKAFKAHSIPVPSAPPLRFVFPNGLPELIQPGQSAIISMNVEEMSRLPQANSGKITYRFNNGSWTTTNMTQTTANQYTITLPGQTCDTIVDFYFTATAAAQASPALPAIDVKYPESAPNTTLYYPVANAIETLVSDDMENNTGWIVGAFDDTATTGIWTLNIPQATGAQPGFDHTPGGSRCWVTDYRAGIQVSDYDVDDGKTTLISPMFDLTGRRHPRVSFWLWYSNDVGLINPNTNSFQIDITSNDGGSWFPLKSVGPTGSEAHGAWRKFDLAIDPPIVLSNQMRVRFVASDVTGAIVEAAMDDYKITSLACTTLCYANCDESTAAPVLNVNDFVCFLNRFAAQDPYANCDASNVPPVLNINDFQCFLNAYAVGCP